MKNPLDYGGDQAKRQALDELERMNACIGAFDDTTIEVQMTPPYGHASIGDVELARVVDCVNILGNVRGLDLSETAISDAGAPHLAKLKGIPYLCLNGTAVTDQCMPFLQSIVGLKELVLSGTHITDASIETLRRMSTLTFLQLFGTQMTREGKAKLKADLPGVIEA